MMLTRSGKSARDPSVRRQANSAPGAGQKGCGALSLCEEHSQCYAGGIVPEYPTVQSLRGIAGSLDRPLSWQDVQEIAHEDRVVCDRFAPIERREPGPPPSTD